MTPVTCDAHLQKKLIVNRITAARSWWLDTGRDMLNGEADERERLHHGERERETWTEALNESAES